MPKEKTTAKLKKELDRIFSLFIRYKYADKNGYVRCYTCDTIKPVKEMQCGHWIPRNILGTRFSEKNCRPQCVGCNMFNRGRPDVFSVNLMKEKIDIVKLQQDRYKVFKVDSTWYEGQIQNYKAKLLRMGVKI